MECMIGFVLFVDRGCWEVVIQLVNYTFSTPFGGSQQSVAWNLT